MIDQLDFHGFEGKVCERYEKEKPLQECTYPSLTAALSLL